MQDLWADFAGEALLTEGAGRSGGLRQHRLTEQAVLTALRAWLLQEYMIPYGTSLGATRIFKRCYWIDGLGNTRVTTPAAAFMPVQNEAEPINKRGRQKTTVQVPILPPALELASATARQLARLDRPITLYGFALDEKRGRRKKAGLKEAAAKPVGQVHNGTEASAVTILPKDGGPLSANWSELAPVLLSTLEQSAAVFVLDPLKDGLFRYSDLAPLYQRTAPTELFLWLSHKQIETRLLPTLRTAGGAAALTNLLRNDRWKGLLTREDSEEHPEQIGDKLIELLVESMRPHFLSVQRLAFPMRGGPALVQIAPYSLIFATRRQDSLYSLNDAVCLRTRLLVTESQRGVLNEEWFTSQREEQATARLKALTQETLALGRTQRVRRWPDLRQQLVLANFGQHTLRDYDQVIVDLLEHGEVRCERRGRTQDAGEMLIPGNDDLLLWNK